MFSWCDALGSLPSVGVKLTPYYATTDALLASFVPVLNKMTESEKALFSIEKSDQFAMQFTSNDGFQYSANAFQIAVASVHRMKLRTNEEGKPYSDMTSSPIPFSEMLPEVAKRTSAAVLRLPMLRERKFDRVGIISSSTFKANKAPPGVCAFTKYLSKPWGEEAKDLNVRIVGNLEKRKDSADRCFHTIARSELNEDDTMTFVLDWQRTFLDGKTVSRSNLDEAIAGAVVAAMQYFEAFGEGGRFND